MTSTVNAPMMAARDVTMQPPATSQSAAQLTIPKLHALTSLRFFAAAMIVMLHSQGYFGAIKPLAQFTLT